MKVAGQGRGVSERLGLDVGWVVDKGLSKTSEKAPGVPGLPALVVVGARSDSKPRGGGGPIGRAVEGQGSCGVNPFDGTVCSLGGYKVC